MSAPVRPSRLPRLAAAFRDRLAAPVDGASLAVFRITFGLVMAWHALKQVVPRSDGFTPVGYWFDDVAWNFAYPGFGWIVPWPQPWLTLHFVAVACAGLLVALGCCYRVSSVALFLLYTYTFLLEQADYNNHYYLMCLIQFLLIWMPAHARFSVDSWWRTRRMQAAATSGDADSESDVIRPLPLRSSQGSGDSSYGGTIPCWPVFLLRAQLFLVYFYGGIAKINADWLSGVPLLSPARDLHTALLGVGLPEAVSVEHVCLFLAWTGLVYDLSIGFLLLSSRTRPLAIVLTAIFHGTNHFLFPIGVFPPMAFAATMIFFPCDWPVRFWSWLRRPRLARPDLRWLAVGAVVLPGVGATLGWGSPRTRRSIRPLWPIHRLVPVCVGVWILTQAVLPLRHYFIEGDANWTEEGQHFAWRMMLRAKAAGHLVFTITDSGLQQDGAIDWSRWPAEQPRAVYVPVDSTQFNWRHHPGLTVLYEPILGERFVYALPDSTSDTIADCRERIAEQWRQTFGAAPRIRPAVGLLTALQSLRADLEQQGGASAADMQRLENVTRVVAENGPGRPAAPRLLVAVADELDRLARADCGEVVLKHLGQVSPFAVQGAVFSDQSFLIVDHADQSRIRPDDSAGRLAGGEPYVIWVDLGRLRPGAWRGLPAAFVTHDSGRLTIYWNQFRELNPLQMTRMSVRPGMIHQYANRIAAMWESQTGRRPAVHVQSYVMLNYRHPRYLVDPDVDLAAAPFTVFGHNPWILPLDKASAGPPERIAASVPSARR